MLLTKHLPVCGIMLYLAGSVVLVANGHKRVFKFTKASNLQSVSNSDRVGRPPISTESTSVISCAALLLQYGPFTCMEYYDLQRRCRSYHEVETVDSLISKMNTEWEFYNANTFGYTKKECKLTAMGTEYRGRTNITVTGIQCQRWDATYPHNVDDSLLADLITIEGDPVISATNYCRNPDDSPDGPWCYTMDPKVRWDVCDVPMCHCYI